MIEPSVDQQLAFHHVDVFSSRPFGGNGLTVFLDSMGLDPGLMQQITQETRQFECLFLSGPGRGNRFDARIFTMEEELGFAGHPLLGGAAVLHTEYGMNENETWRIYVQVGKISVTSERITPGVYRCKMMQPAPEFRSPIARDRLFEIVRSLSLSTGDLHDDLPVQVVSTGLPYLIVPLKRGLEKAKIAIQDFEHFLSQFGAKFVYAFAVPEYEGRTWDNDGRIEDIATGSAAGPVAAYLCKHSYLYPNMDLEIRQGSFVGRPSKMSARVIGMPHTIAGIEVAGDVTEIASGCFITGNQIR